MRLWTFVSNRKWCDGKVQRWGYLANFRRSFFSQFFLEYKNTNYPLDIVFISDKCRHSLAAVAYVKYKCDSMNLTGTFLSPTISLSEKLTNGTLVSSLPDGLCAETWPDIEGRGWSFYWLRISAQCTSNNYGKYSDTHGEMKLCSDD